MRVAERQGRFTGTLNPVQQFGLELLVFADARENQKERAETFKMMLAASNPQFISKLYPKSKEEQDEGDAEEVDIEHFNVDNPQTSWGYTEQMDAKEGRELLNRLRSGKMKVTDLSDNEGWV